ncbi:hypothetical protein FACS1894151_11760 [Spirochaetia bacterium]|nr:hypothetical protein FACS1894151_11760 [Spirochaetia bacterium]
MAKGIETYTQKEEGFKAVMSYGSWRIAMANGPEVYRKKDVTSMGCHYETDEVFVLLKGSAVLLTAGNGALPGEVEHTWMEQGVLYNVTRGTWHNRIDMPGTQVLVVENDNTSAANSKDADLAAPVGL